MTDKRIQTFNDRLDLIQDFISQYKDGMITAFELHGHMIDQLSYVDPRPLKEQHDEQMAAEQ